MRLLITRPGAAGEALAARLAALGHEAVVEPLLDIALLPPPAIEADGIAAVAVTSANALAAIEGGAGVAALSALPLFAVGAATAARAAAVGFADVRGGEGGAEALARSIAASLDPAAGALLYLSGADIAFDLAAALAPAGIAVRRLVVYRAEPARSLTPATVRLLSEGGIDGIVLMSARTAATYARLVTAAGLADAVRPIAHVCISGPVAGALGPLSLNHVHVATRPDTEEVLASIAFAAAKSASRS